jgi:hypothetical protein
MGRTDSLNVCLVRTLNPSCPAPIRVRSSCLVTVLDVSGAVGEPLASSSDRVDPGCRPPFFGSLLDLSEPGAHALDGFGFSRFAQLEPARDGEGERHIHLP